MRKINLILALVFMFSLSMVLALGDADDIFHKIADYNDQKADFYLNNISFLIAFLAGIISLLLPCTLAILPAFFAYSFKEKTNLVKMTLVFFFGFAIIFVVYGIIASILGKSLVSIQLGNKFLIFIAGVLILFFGFLTLFGYGISSLIKHKLKPKKDIFGIFIFGILFALGWSACLGPILAGILLMASTFNNLVTASLLLFFYSLGLFVPLFLLSYFFEKINMQKFRLLNKEIEILYIKTTLINIIAGILLFIIGLLFIIYGGTSIINSSSLFPSLIELTYNLENNLLNYNKFVLNIIGAVILIMFLVFLYYVLKQKKHI